MSPTDLATFDVARMSAALAETTSAFAAAVADLDPDTTVPTCPDWSVRVLVGHLGQASRWGAEVVRTGTADGLPDPRGQDPGPQAGWATFLQAGAAELVDAVRAADRTATVWTPVGPCNPDFWLRRMLNDAAVHLADATSMAGRPYIVAPELAVDVISEVLELVSAPLARTLNPSADQLRGTGQTMLLRPDEVVGWLVTRTPDGVRWTRAHRPADVELRGPARDLVLVLARRLPPTAVTITGDRALLDHWLANTPY